MEKENKTDVLKQINNFFDEFNKLETEEEQTAFMEKKFPNVFSKKQFTNPLNVLKYGRNKICRNNGRNTLPHYYH